MKNLTIMAWNANGLLHKRNELQTVLEINNIDICLISETHATRETICKIKGYNFYHSYHPSNCARGGSGILIKQSIQHYEDTILQTEKAQITSTTIKTKKYPITIASIYCPPRHKLEEHEFTEIIQQLGNRFILGGDFNSKHTHWGSRLITTKGQALMRAIRSNKCEVLSTGKPTYWPADQNKQPDLIDFFITKNIHSNYIMIEENNELSSDHTPIILTLSENPIQKPHNPVLVNKGTDWISFRIELARNIDLKTSIETQEDLETELSKLVNSIQSAAWNNTPEIKIKLHGINYPREVIHLIREKRKARKKWLQTRAPAHKTTWNQLTRRLNSEIRNIKSTSVQAYLSDLSAERCTEYSLWKATKWNKRPILQAPPLKDAQRNWIKDNQSKADLFADYLANTFKPNPESTNQQPLEYAALKDHETKIQPTTIKEIQEMIKSEIKTKKAPGYDLITGQILKNLPRKAIVQITKITNAVFRLEYVPQLWKFAEVIMIPKSGKPLNEITSYRPISLLPVLSKLFEKLILRRITPIIEERKLIPNHQFGFRKKHSTIDQVHRIITNIEQALEEKKVTSAVFLDVSQAFDKVWHEGLNHKIRKALPACYAKVFESYLADRYFRIKQEEAYSELKKINAGVPQGSVLGPLLYLLYTSDLPEICSNITATFADDTAILATGHNNYESTQKLNTSLSKIQEWTAKWRIKLNETKSVHVDFTNKKVTHIPVYINNNIIPYSNQAKYLGMTLDTRLRWKVHVKKKREELNINFKKIYWIIGRNSSMSIENKLLLYKQVLKPVWTYGIQLWGCTAQSNRNIIQRFQNNVLRCIVNAPWYIRNADLHRDLGVETVSETIKKLSAAHQTRLQGHVNEEALQLLNVDTQTRRLKRIKPHELC